MSDDSSARPERELENVTDQSLLRRFRAGEDDAATELYFRYAGRLINLADRQVYDDIALQADREGIVQSVFRTFFRRASAGQYDAVSGDDLWKLMLAIALNKIRSTGTRHRAARRSATRTRPLEDSGAVADPDAGEQELARMHLQMTIEELLGQLPDDQRRIILLRIDGHEVNEISTRTGRAKRSVERILQQFRQRLERVWREEDQP